MQQQSLITFLCKGGFDNKLYRARDYFTWSLNHEIQVNPQNPAKFTKTHQKPRNIWNLSQLLLQFNCRKLANLSWNEQHPKTTRRKLCFKKLGTSHNIKRFAIGSFLNGIVVERANDYLLLKKCKSSGQIIPKPINFYWNLPWKFPQISRILLIVAQRSLPRKFSRKSREISWFSTNLSLKIPRNLTFFSATYQKPWLKWLQYYFLWLFSLLNFL